MCIPARGTMKETNVADTVQAVLEGSKGRTLREEHEDTVETLVQIGVFFWLKELKAEVWRGDRVREESDDRSYMKRNKQVNTGDSRSCTSLSIWISMLTVISSSALNAHVSTARQQRRPPDHTIFEEDCKLAHKPGREGIERTWRRHCGTRTGKGQQKTSDPPKHTVSGGPNRRSWSKKRPSSQDFLIVSSYLTALVQ